MYRHIKLEVLNLDMFRALDAIDLFCLEKLHLKRLKSKRTKPLASAERERREHVNIPKMAINLYHNWEPRSTSL